MRITLEPAFILHTRPFNETSLILDVFTASYGRVHLIAKGARTQRSCYRGILRPFTPLLLSWSGKTELMTLVTAECRATPIILNGMAMLSGLYLNELLIRLLPKSDDHPDLFIAYEQTLLGLKNNGEIEKSLRVFEKILLRELGYALSLDREMTEDKSIMDEAEYVFFPGQGFIKNTFHHEDYVRFKGRHLRAFHNDVLEDKEVLSVAKQLMRLAIAHLLEGQPLRTRAYFQQ